MRTLITGHKGYIDGVGLVIFGMIQVARVFLHFGMVLNRPNKFFGDLACDVASRCHVVLLVSCCEMYTIVLMGLRHVKR